MKKIFPVILLLILLAGVVSVAQTNEKGKELMAAKPKVVKMEKKGNAVFTIEDLEKKATELKANRDQLQANINALNGAIQLTEILVNELKAKAAEVDPEAQKPVDGIVEPPK
jgi:peptidoglycan hydrolase CwlO-like protein